MLPQTGSPCAALYLRDKLSVSYIAGELSRDESTIRYLFEKVDSTDSADRREGSGRPRITSPQDDRHIHRTVQKDRYITGGEIVQESGVDVSERTARRRVGEFELHSFWASKKFEVRESVRVSRVEWAEEHISWSPSRWRSVVWSDFSPFMFRYT